MMIEQFFGITVPLTRLYPVEGPSRRFRASVVIYRPVSGTAETVLGDRRITVDNMSSSDSDVVRNFFLFLCITVDNFFFAFI